MKGLRTSRSCAWVRHGLRDYVAAAAVAVALTAVGACADHDASDPGNPPLGWNGPIEAREVRFWSSASMDSVPRWTVVDEPAFAAAPGSRDADPGRRGQRRVSEGAFLPDGRVVLLYDQIVDSTLLHFLDPASGAESKVPPPRGEDSRALNWSYFRMAVSDRGLVLVGDNESRLQRRMKGRDIWHADLTGSFLRPPSFAGVEGSLIGVLPDGSLALNERCSGPDAAGKLLLCSTVVVRAREPGGEEERGDTARVAFTGGYLIDPARPGNWPAPWAHFHVTTSVVAREWIWVVPTERPELVAVDRSGDVRLKIEWDGGDRTVPPGATGFGAQAERFPAAADLKAGTDGTIYVQRWTLQGAGSPVQGPEWLVFSQEGDLAARLNVPGNLRVLAFGNNALLAVANVGSAPSRDEVRVYEMRPAGQVDGRSPGRPSPASQHQPFSKP